MAMKKAAPKKAAPKASGSDRGAKMKANEAEKKSQAQKMRKNEYFNLTPAEKKALGPTSIRSAYTGGNRVLPNEFGVSGKYVASGATTRRATDQDLRERQRQQDLAKKREKTRRAEYARKAKQKER